MKKHLNDALIAGAFNLSGALLAHPLFRREEPIALMVDHALTTALCGALAGALLPDWKYKPGAAMLTGIVAGNIIVDTTYNWHQTTKPVPEHSSAWSDKVQSTRPVIHTFNTWQEAAAASKTSAIRAHG